MSGAFAIPTAKPVGDVKRLTPSELQHKRERGAFVLDAMKNGWLDTDVKTRSYVC